MHEVVRKRRGYRLRGGAPRPALRQQRAPGTLPSFLKPLGLDFIVTPEGRALLIEMQSGFGRAGLLELFPETGTLYRRTYWARRREHGRCWTITEGVRRVCADKVATYKLLSEFQPPSLPYHRFTPRVARWLEGLESEFVLAKPPRGSCGEGILVLERRGFEQAAARIPPGKLMLLQEFVESRKLPGRDASGVHVGCIRHIVMLCSDGQRMSVTHMPSYWRVSPAPFVRRADYEALTANISRGAHPWPVDEADSNLVRRLAERVCARLVRHVLELERLEVGPSTVLQADETPRVPAA